MKMKPNHGYGWLSASAPESCDYITPLILKILSRDFSSFARGSILDIGSGNGFLCAQLAEIGYHVEGLEPDERGIEISRLNYPHIKFHNFGVDADPSNVIGENNKLFDIVISTEVIEHLYSPGQLPRLAGRVLRDDGLLIISTPYHGYLKNLALAVMNKWDYHHHPLRDGGHIKFWSCNTLTQLLHENGFEVVEFHGVGRISYLWKSMVVIAKKCR